MNAKRLSSLAILMVVAVVPCAAQEPVVIDLDSAEGLTISTPAGFNQAGYSFGSVPDGEGTNGQGLTIAVNDGEGLLVYGPSVETGPGDVLIECSVWAKTPDLYLALVGLNAPVDGSLIANMPANGSEYEGGWHSMRVIYDPNDDSIMPAFQVASLADGLGIVHVDQIVVTPVRGLYPSEVMELFGVPTLTPTPTYGSHAWLMLRGTVTSAADGRPIPGALIRVDEHSTESYADGSYNIDVNGFETYMVVVEAPGYQRFETSIRFYSGSDNSQELNISLTPEPDGNPTYTPTPTVTPTSTWGPVPEYAWLVRDLPETVQPGVPFTVEFRYGGGGALIVAATEVIPAGWTVVSPDEDAVIDGNTIFWERFPESYELVAPEDAPLGTYTFSGSSESSHYTTGRVTRTTQGDDSLILKGVPPIHTPTPTPIPTVTPPPGPGETITIDIPGLPESAKPLEMVLIPAGTFTMGCPSTERGYPSHEWPPHQVTITQPFYLGKYEVTQAQWQAVMGSNPSSDSSVAQEYGTYGVGDDYPVYWVSWDVCQTFISRLNETGQGTFRLPTEAQWELACRAGTTTRFSFGDALECDDDCGFCEIQDQHMWWCGNSPTTSKEVGTKLPNPWGLYDMHGNLDEWCSDRWDDPFDRGPQTDPQGSTEGEGRVFRGGYWGENARNCRSAVRRKYSQFGRGRDVGVRLARSSR